MTMKTTILAGTALGLVMAAAPLAAKPFPAAGAFDGVSADSRIVLAQASVDELRVQLQAAEDAGDEALAAQLRAQIEAAESAPAEEPAAEEPVEEPAAEEPAAEEPAAEEPAAEEPAAEEPAAEEPAAEEPAAEEPAAEEPATEEPAAEEPAAEEPAAEEPTAEEPAAEEPAAEEEAEEPASQIPTVPTEGTEPSADVEAETDAEADVEVDEDGVDAEADAEVDADAEVETAPEGEEPAMEEPADGEEAPVEGESEEEIIEQDGDSAESAPDSGEPAPILDSAKDAGNAGEPVAEEEAVAEEDLPPPPESDANAQAEGVVEGEIQSAVAEEGQRIEISEEDRRERRERREGAEVVREIGDRILIQFNNQIIVQNYDQPRLGRNATEVYYEELPRGRTREVVIRENGVQVITIRDRYGDVIRRSRITPDGREYVLVYADGRDRDRDRREWRDPARELPPLRLRVPVEEYILEARYVEEPDAYYEFLDSPPVEQVERLYTVDEVRYSARVRDIMPRVELDTLTFNFGSAEIDDSQVGALEGLAEAMQRMLEENPGETFMIEGHTDAVGSDEANLALSDQRAETIAIVLTDYFDIPPENLVTQGYGEQYLKIETQSEERENRRVVVRRITPLVAPVASAQ